MPRISTALDLLFFLFRIRTFLWKFPIQLSGTLLNGICYRQQRVILLGYHPGKLDKQLNNQCDDKQNKKSCRFIYQIDVRCKAEQRSHHILTVLRCPNRCISRWCRWFLSASENLCPLSFLLKIAPMVSTMGTASSRIGSASVIIVELLKPSNEIADIIKPRNKAPQSPMKILAGCELYSRNPMVAPARIKDIVWISSCLLYTSDAADEL